MAENIVTNPLGLVLIATAHMVFTGQAEVNGILGSNVTLEFRFNDTVIDNKYHLAVYITGETKIAECPKNKGCLSGGVFEISQNTTVLYHIKKLSQKNNGTYWASLFQDSGRPKESNKVQLIVQAKNTNTTGALLPNNVTANKDSGSSNIFSFHVVTVLVVSPVVLLAAVLPLLIWSLVRTKDKQQPNSNVTEQETVEPRNSVPPPSIVYSVLDFPKRSPAALDHNPNDTEYAAVSYLPEKRQM